MPNFFPLTSINLFHQSSLHKHRLICDRCELWWCWERCLDLWSPIYNIINHQRCRCLLIDDWTCKDVIDWSLIAPTYIDIFECSKNKIDGCWVMIDRSKLRWRWLLWFVKFASWLRGDERTGLRWSWRVEDMKVKNYKLFLFNKLNIRIYLLI